MSSFNVAQILPSLDSGGVERGTIEVANYLSKLNLKNNIISNGGRLINEIYNVVVEVIKITKYEIWHVFAFSNFF